LEANLAKKLVTPNKLVMVDHICSPSYVESVGKKLTDQD
jgi:hypothetical protein